MYGENPDESCKLHDRLDRCQELDYFKPKRQDQLLVGAHAIQRSFAQKMASASQPSMLPSSQLLPGTSIPPLAISCSRCIPLSRNLAEDRALTVPHSQWAMKEVMATPDHDMVRWSRSTTDASEGSMRT